MDNEQKVVVACPKCGQKLRCAAGGVGTCPKCGERISFSINRNKSDASRYVDTSLFDEKSRKKMVFKCPHCSHTQYKKTELCEKCGKPMRQVAKIQMEHWLIFGLSVFFTLSGFASDSFPFALIGIIGLIVFIIIAIYCSTRNGKFISSDKYSNPYFFPYLKFSDCKGIPEFEQGHSGTIRLDELEKCFIIKDDLDKYERLLPFSQISEFELKVRHVEKDKSVIGRSVAGYLIAGPVGSVVGAASGMGKKQESQQYLEISYHPKGNRSRENTAEFVVSSCSNTFYKDSREALGITQTKNKIANESPIDYL